MTKPLHRVAVDTCVVIDAVIGTDAEKRRRSEWVVDQDRTSHLVVLPAIVPPEVLGAGVIRSTDGGAEARRQRIKDAQDWLDKRRYIVASLDQRASRRAAEFAPRFNLKGADACVLACAELAQCTVLYTWDGALLRVGTQVPGLSVQQPDIPKTACTQIPLLD